MKHANVLYDTLKNGVLYVRDGGDGTQLSITNDAEWVVSMCLDRLPTAERIVYRDTMGDWGELGHKDGVFVTFLPWNGWTPDD